MRLWGAAKGFWGLRVRGYNSGGFGFRSSRVDRVITAQEMFTDLGLRGSGLVLRFGSRGSWFPGVQDFGSGFCWGFGGLRGLRVSDGS